jgi:hypothetical protein
MTLLILNDKLGINHPETKAVQADLDALKSKMNKR